MKWIGLGVGGIVGLAIILALVLLLINAWDVPLDPRAAAILEERHDLVPAKDNAYFAIAALDMPASADEVGEPLLCGRAQRLEDCIERLRARPDDAAEVLSANRAFLAQYEALADYLRFEDPVPLTDYSKILKWHPFLVGQQFFLTEQALSIGRGDVDAAIDHLQRDVAFNRRMLAERDQLIIDKVVPAAALRNTLLFIADLARSVALTDAQFKRLGDIVTPLTDQERSLGGVYNREFTGFASTMTSLRDGDVNGSLWNYLQFRFFKRNDTLNLQWALVQQEEAASAAPCTELVARQNELLKSAKIPAVKFLYNPIGKLLFKIAVPTADHYPMVLCDLQGMQSIMALQLEMRGRGLTGTDAAEYLRNKSDDYRNPYTHQPFVWDAVGKTLTFSPVAERDRRYLPWAI